MKTNQVYSEVYAILIALGDEYIQKTPPDIFDFVANNRDKNHVIEIDENLPLEEQNLSKETISFIAMLKLDYWCQTDEEKAELLSLLETNEEKIKEVLAYATSTREMMRLLRKNG